MSREKLLTTLSKFENCGDSESICNNEGSLATMEADIKRLDFSFYSFSGKKNVEKLYRNLLFKTLNNLSVEYLQGMAEISLAIVVAYFKEIVENADISFVNSEEDASNYFVFHSDDEKNGFENFLIENSDIYDKVKNALNEVIKKTYMVLWKDKLKLHNEYHDVFISIMKDRGIQLKIKPMENMSHVFTFFTRICSTENVVYEIFNIILNNEVSILYVLLILLYKYTQSEVGHSSSKYNKTLAKLPNNFMEKVDKMHIAFKKRLKDKRSSTKCKSCYFFLGVATIVIVSIVAANYNKKK